MARGVKREATTKHIYPADLACDHRVGRSAVERRRSRIGDGRVDGIAVLQAVKATAGLHGGIEVRRGKCQAVRLAGAVAVRRTVQAKSVGGVGLLEIGRASCRERV